MHVSDVGGGEAERNPTGGNLSGRKMRNLNNIHEVMVLACEIADGDTRRASLVSIDEIRAVAMLAAHASLVVHAAAVLLDASDNDLPKEHLAELMKLLAQAVRPFMGRRS